MSQRFFRKMTDIEHYIKKRKYIIDKALDSYLPKVTDSSSIIHNAMRYSVISDAKRLRPIFLIAAAESCGGNIRGCLSAACAIELIHTYSLIHDDLPSMDNAALRRGKPSCHKKFGEAIAVLTGDALLTLAFKLMAPGIIKDICDAIGTKGMVGGQALENQISNIKYQRLKIKDLEKISRLKTGALFAVSVKVGGILAGANAEQINALFNFGKNVGLAFQITDDILDKEGYALALGRKKAMAQVQRLIACGKHRLERVIDTPDILCGLADYVVNRKR